MPSPQHRSQRAFPAGSLAASQPRTPCSEQAQLPENTGFCLRAEDGHTGQALGWVCLSLQPLQLLPGSSAELWQERSPASPPCLSPALFRVSSLPASALGSPGQSSGLTLVPTPTIGSRPLATWPQLRAPAPITPPRPSPFTLSTPTPHLVQKIPHFTYSSGPAHPDQTLRAPVCSHQALHPLLPALFRGALTAAPICIAHTVPTCTCPASRTHSLVHCLSSLLGCQPRVDSKHFRFIHGVSPVLRSNMGENTQGGP